MKIYRAGSPSLLGSVRCWPLVAALTLFSVPVAGQDRIISLDEEVIEGRIEKPEAFYILQPTNLTYERSEDEESFVPELLETVEDDPF